MSGSGWKVGVMGATGAVGREVLDVLGRRRFPLADVRLYASPRSAGTRLDTPVGPREVRPFDLDDALDLDVAFLAISGSFSKEFGPALAKGPVVIDNSSAFRYDPEIPLVVPEVNADAVSKLRSRLIANPNCTTAILCMALDPIHREFGVRRVIVSTYQASSGAGAAGMSELVEQLGVALRQEEPTVKVFPYPLAFNVIPQIDVFQDNGYTREEMKVVWETRRIMEVPDMAISCTAVRVPTLRVHAEAVTIETERPVTPAGAREALSRMQGVVVCDDPLQRKYPMPRTCHSLDDVHVGRIRQNIVFGDHGLDMFVCGDQLLKGAALNAVQIAEVVLEREPAMLSAAARA